MSHVQKLGLTVLSLLAVLWLIAETSSAKSLYVISDTGTVVWESPLIQAYQIDGNDLIHRADYYCKYPLATGLAIDSDAGFLFVTHEEIAGKPETRGDLVEIVNAKSMTYGGTAPAPDAQNLAGIVYDRGKKKVYVADRKTPDLYVFAWG